MKRTILALVCCCSLYSMQSAQQTLTNNNNEQVKYTQEEQDAAREMFSILRLLMISQEEAIELQSLLKKYPRIVNIKYSSSCMTALMLAVLQGDLDIIKAIIEAGADINAQSNGGMTALMEAASWGHADIAKLLIEAGANINARNTEGSTALLYAAGNRRAADVVKILVNAGANLDLRVGQGETALMYAAVGCWIDRVKLFIAAGADQTIKDKQGRTAADIAKQSGCEKEYEAGVQEGEAERARYLQTQKAAHQQVVAHCIIPDLADIITGYAYNSSDTQDLPSDSLQKQNKKRMTCAVQ